MGECRIGWCRYTGVGIDADWGENEKVGKGLENGNIDSSETTWWVM